MIRRAVPAMTRPTSSVSGGEREKGSGVDSDPSSGRRTPANCASEVERRRATDPARRARDEDARSVAASLAISAVHDNSQLLSQDERRPPPALRVA